MTEERGLRDRAILPVGLSEALASYDALAERVGQSPDVGSRDEARRQALEAHFEWAAELREHFRLEDRLLGVNDSPFDSTHIGEVFVGEYLRDSPAGGERAAPGKGRNEESRELDLARRLGTDAATMPFIPRYKLGVGGQGEVWLAHDPELDRFVALKVIKENQRASQSTAARFWREAELTGKLEHPNIVPVYAAGRGVPAASCRRGVEAQADISTHIGPAGAGDSAPHPHGDAPLKGQEFSVGEREETSAAPYYVMRVFGNRHLLRAITAFHARQRSQPDWELLEAIKAFHEQRSAVNDQRLQHALSAFPFNPSYECDRDLQSACEALRKDPAGQSGRSLHEAIQTYHAGSRQPGELRELLNRFIDVCNAMAYAHSRGVIHRDLKPQNVMLGEFGETLVVDWGLAKVLTSSSLPSPPGRGAGGEGASHADASINPLQIAADDSDRDTQQGTIVGTLAYMPPEQAWGKINELTPATDVFSLGGILYAILTGRPPLAGVTRSQLLEAARSAKVAAPSALQPDIPKALEAVTLKALSKSPAQRYPTAKDLAADVTRWLADEPVTAWPEPVIVRAKRWVRRHQTLATTTAAVVLISAIGLATFSTIVSDKNQKLSDLNDDLVDANENLIAANQRETTARLAAQDQSQLALETLTQVIFDVQRGLEDLPGGGEVRRRLLATSLEKLEQVASEYVAQTTVDRNTMVALMEMGDVIVRFGVGVEDAGPSRDHAIETQELTAEQEAAAELAREFYNRAHIIALELTAADSSNVVAMRDLSVSYYRLGDVSLSLGDAESAREFYQKYNDLCERLTAVDPSDAKAQCDLSLSYIKLGHVNLQSGNTDIARDSYEESREIAERLISANPGSVEAEEHLAASYHSLGDVYRQLGDTQSAIDFYAKGHDIYERLAFADPGNVEAERLLTLSYDNLGDMQLQLGDTESAKVFYQQGLDIAQRLATADPADNEAQQDLLIAYHNLGTAELQSGDPAAARDFLEKVLNIGERLAAADPTNSQMQRHLCLTYQNLGYVCMQMGDTIAARDTFQNGLEISERLALADQSNFESQLDLSVSYDRLGLVYLQLGDMERARDFHQQGLDIAERLATADPAHSQAQRNLSLSYDHLGFVYQQMGDTTAARGFFEQGLEISERLAAEDPANTEAQRDLSIAYQRQGDVSLLLGDNGSAEDFYHKLNDITGRLAASDPTNSQAQRDLMASQYRLANVAAAMLEYDTAIEHYTTAVAVLDRMIADGQNVTQSQQEREALVNELRTVESEAAQARAALADWDTFISQPEHESMLSLRMQLLARAGRYDEIPQTVEMLRALNSADAPDSAFGGLFSALLDGSESERPTNLYNAACGYAVCASAIQSTDGMELTPEQQIERQEYIELALACLSESIAAGWSDFEHMQQDPDLAVLRELPEFEELMHIPPAPALAE